LRTAGVVLVLRNRDGGEDADNRHHDHQLDEREALLNAFHENSPDE